MLASRRLLPALAVLLSAAARNCPAGQFLSKEQAFGQLQGVCRPCPMGHFALLGVCVPCDRGTFADAPGKNACSPCPAGTSAHRMAQTSCDDCAPGTISTGPGARFCTHCAVGRHQPAAGRTSCVECGANMRGGSAPRSSDAHCVACEAGRWRELGTDSTACVACAPGHFRSGSVALCIACAAGRFAQYPAAAACAACPAGRFHAGTGASDCADCAAGQHASAEGSAACADCEAGRSTPLTGEVECKGCAAGQYKSNDDLDEEAECNLCAAGQFSDKEGADECIVCPEGRHARQAGEARCVGATCTTGRYSTASGCKACAPGTHSTSPPGLACAKCAVGFFQHERASAACYESKCVRGHYQDPHSRDCLACPWGKHQPLPKQGACAACPGDTVPARSADGLHGVCKPRKFYHKAAAAPLAEHSCSHLTCELQHHHTCAHRKVWSFGDATPALSESALQQNGLGLGKLQVWSVGCLGKRATRELPASELATEQSYTSIRVFHHGDEGGARHRCRATKDGTACACVCWTDAPPPPQSAPTAGPTAAATAEVAWGGETPAEQVQDLG